MDEVRLDLLLKWYNARKEMLAYLGDTDKWMKVKGKSMEVDQTEAFTEIWSNFSNAEWSLSDHIKESYDI